MIIAKNIELYISDATVGFVVVVVRVILINQVHRRIYSTSAIANYRLYRYDWKWVTFWYKDNQRKIHYGAYCRKKKRMFKRYLPLKSLTQMKLSD